MATVTCQCCGRTLEGARATRKYCAECRLAVRRENSRLRTIRKKRKKIHLDPLAEIALEVQAYNDNRGPDDPCLSYGQYVAKFGK